MREISILIAAAALVACAAPRDTRFQLVSENTYEFKCPKTPGEMTLQKFMGALSECADLASK